MNTDKQNTRRWNKGLWVYWLVTYYLQVFLFHFWAKYLSLGRDFFYCCGVLLKKSVAFQICLWKSFVLFSSHRKCYATIEFQVATPTEYTRCHTAVGMNCTYQNRTHTWKMLKLTLCIMPKRLEIQTYRLSWVTVVLSCINTVVGRNITCHTHTSAHYIDIQKSSFQLYKKRQKGFTVFHLHFLEFQVSQIWWWKYLYCSTLCFLAVPWHSDNLPSCQKKYINEPLIRFRCAFIYIYSELGIQIWGNST